MIALGHLKLLLFVSCVLAASSELDALTTTSSHDLPRNRSTSFITYSVRSTRYVPFPRPTAIPTQDPMYTRTIYLSYPYSMPTTTKWSFTTESPVFTICPLPLTSPGSAPWRRQIPDLSSTPRAPFLNQTSSVEVVTTCSTAFVTRVTTACKTTLTPLGGLLIHITDCSQRITFSTDHGFVVESRKKPELLTTNYIAPWANVISGVPTGTVEALVCPRDGLCTTYLEYWGTRALLAVSTSTSTIRFATILEGVSGPFLSIRFG